MSDEYTVVLLPEKDLTPFEHLQLTRKTTDTLDRQLTRISTDAVKLNDENILKRRIVLNLSYDEAECVEMALILYREILFDIYKDPLIEKYKQMLKENEP